MTLNNGTFVGIDNSAWLQKRLVHNFVCVSWGNGFVCITHSRGAVVVIEDRRERAVEIPCRLYLTGWLRLILFAVDSDKRSSTSIPLVSLVPVPRRLSYTGDARRPPSSGQLPIQSLFSILLSLPYILHILHRRSFLLSSTRKLRDIASAYLLTSTTSRRWSSWKAGQSEPKERDVTSISSRRRCYYCCLSFLPSHQPRPPPSPSDVVVPVVVTMTALTVRGRRDVGGVRKSDRSRDSERVRRTYSSGT